MGQVATGCFCTGQYLLKTLFADHSLCSSLFADDKHFQSSNFQARDLRRAAFNRLDVPPEDTRAGFPPHEKLKRKGKKGVASRRFSRSREQPTGVQSRGSHGKEPVFQHNFPNPWPDRTGRIGTSSAGWLVCMFTFPPLSWIVGGPQSTLPRAVNDRRLIIRNAPATDFFYDTLQLFAFTLGMSQGNNTCVQSAKKGPR